MKFKHVILYDGDSVTQRKVKEIITWYVAFTHEVLAPIPEVASHHAVVTTRKCGTVHTSLRVWALSSATCAHNVA